MIKARGGDYWNFCGTRVDDATMLNPILKHTSQKLMMYDHVATGRELGLRQNHLKLLIKKVESNLVQTQGGIKRITHSDTGDRLGLHINIKGKEADVSEERLMKARIATGFLKSNFPGGMGCQRERGYISRMRQGDE